MRQLPAEPYYCWQSSYRIYLLRRQVRKKEGDRTKRNKRGKTLSFKAKAVILSITELILVSVCGSIAYLQSKSDTVVNTFTYGKLVEGEFKLLEHEAVLQADGSYKLTETEVLRNEYKVVPGCELPKDPFIKVTVTEKAYLFLVVCDSLPKEVSWNIDTDNWEALTHEEGKQVSFDGKNPVYVYKGNGASRDNLIPANTELNADNTNIIFNQKILVPEGFNVSDIQAGNDELRFAAYLVQADTFENALAAWRATFGKQ